jgi:dihydrofolate reductase
MIRVASEQGMRRLILQMGISLDGMVAAPRRDGASPVVEGTWDLPPEDPELTEVKLGWVRNSGAHVMGRVTYEEMAAYWPTSTHAYAAPMNEVPKVVFSQTLEHADWPVSRIVRGDLADGVARLKREAGNDLVAHGGASFAQALARANLIDEYRLVTHPIAVGHGLPLFKDLPGPLRLELVDTHSFASASVYVYRRAAPAPS